MKAYLHKIIILSFVASNAYSQILDKNSFPPPKSITIGSTQSEAHAQQMVQTARLFYAFWNSGKEEYVRAAVAPEFKDNTLPKGRPQGFDGLLFASKNFRMAVPDLTCSIEDLLVAGDKVTARLQFNGHNTGAMGHQPPSGKAIAFFAIDILHIRNGKIMEDWHLEDNLTFLQQIGVVKE